MLTGLILILLSGHFSGHLARRLKAPALIGMILSGIALGPQLLDLLPSDLLNQADSFRTFAVMVILMKAGLGLDRDKLQQQGSVALRLGFLPGACEMAVVAIAAIPLLGFDLPTGLLLGCILGAESPAVIVPAMLKLKAQGWGVTKGIPDAILTGSALSDVLLLLLFSLLISYLAPTTEDSAPWLAALNQPLLLPLQVILQIILQISFALLLGWLTAKLLPKLLIQQRWAASPLEFSLVTAGIALALVIGAQRIPLYSGYLATMAAGYFLIGQDAPLARQLRQGFDSLWAIAQIFLFVLLGASIRLDVLEQRFGVGLLILAIGTVLGRSLGWALSTAGSNWTLPERLFLLPGNSAKATVQAAVGAIPLALDIPGGEEILAISALSILITAPLGAWAIPWFAPRLLQRGEVDPTKVAIAKNVTLLAAIDRSPATAAVLGKAAELARRANATVVVLHVRQPEDTADLEPLQQQVQQQLADIRHHLVFAEAQSGAIGEDAIAKTILTTAQAHQADEIILGRPGYSHPAPNRPNQAPPSPNPTAQTILKKSPIPIIVIASD